MPWFLRVLLFVLPSLAITYAYVAWRLSAAIAELTGWPRSAVRWLIAGLAGVLNLYVVLLLVGQILGLTSFTLALRSGGGWADALSFPFWGGLILCVELLPILLLLHLMTFPLSHFFRRSRQQWRRWQAWLSVACSVCLVVYVGIRIAYDTSSLRVSHKDIAIDDLPADLDGFRIVQLSDLQADAHTTPARMRRYVSLANSQHPDLVLFAGDVVTSGRNYINTGASMLGALRARLGVFACLGDHDYWAAPELVVQELRRNGVRVYEDSVLTISASASKLSLTILTNTYQRRPPTEKLHELRRQRPPAAFHLLLTHQPTNDVVSFAENNGYGLVVAGHTHGGQVVFRPFGFRVSVSMLETDYVSGFFEAGRTLVSVTNGLGLTFAPVRYQAPAEVTVLTLRRRAGLTSL